MREFLDTSVLVAAHLGDHQHHERSLAVLCRASVGASACAAHSLAEVYAVLTRLPVRPAIRPEQAMLFLQDVRRTLTVVALDPGAYWVALEAAASRGITGSAVYDALLLRCASEASAETVYTWNVRHFQRLDPSIADRIRTP